MLCSSLCLDEVGHVRFRHWRGLAQLSFPEQRQEMPLILIACVIRQLFFPLSRKKLGVPILPCVASFLLLCNSEAVASVFCLTTFAFLHLIARTLCMCKDGLRDSP